MTSLEIELFKDTCSDCVEPSIEYLTIPNHGGLIKFDMSDKLKTTVVKDSGPKCTPIEEPKTHRGINVGASDYAKRKIQPWDIWLEYKLNPWDADIIKRILRTKIIGGMTPTEARIEDYQKIKHICDERIAQLEGKYK